MPCMPGILLNMNGFQKPPERFGGTVRIQLKRSSAIFAGRAPWRRSARAYLLGTFILRTIIPRMIRMIAASTLTPIVSP